MLYPNNGILCSCEKEQGISLNYYEVFLGYYWVRKVNTKDFGMLLLMWKRRHRKCMSLFVQKETGRIN